MNPCFCVGPPGNCPCVRREKGLEPLPKNDFGYKHVLIPPNETKTVVGDPAVSDQEFDHAIDDDEKEIYISPELWMLLTPTERKIVNLLKMEAFDRWMAQPD